MTAEPAELVPIMIRFERAFNRDANVVGLFLGQFGELDAQVVQVEAGHLFVQFLGQNVYAHIVFF